jgi:hypothetical protein
MKTTNMTTLPLKSISHSRPPVTYHYSLLTVLLFALACIGLWPAPKAFGVSPAPDGGYANGNTAEGANALFSLTTGVNNTAVGFDALFHTTTGSYNTATGEQTLYLNVTGIYNGHRLSSAL